jgi:lipoate-protein ligase B
MGPPSPTGGADLWVVTLGVVAYAEAETLQERVRTARQAEEIPDCLLLLEHPPVYTKGRRAQPQDLPMGEDWYRTQGVEVREADRGGQVTYHGPGQLVGYPIVRVQSVHDYVATLERALIAALADQGVAAEVRHGLTGVWAGEAKIGSIGVHVSRGVTTHGFAINVDCDLQPFEWIVPCGIGGVRMTSVYRETRETDAMPRFRKRVAWRLAQGLGRRRRSVSAAHLEAAIGRAGRVAAGDQPGAAESPGPISSSRSSTRSRAARPMRLSASHRAP